MWFGGFFCRLLSILKFDGTLYGKLFRYWIAIDNRILLGGVRNQNKACKAFSVSWYILRIRYNRFNWTVISLLFKNLFSFFVFHIGEGFFFFFFWKYKSRPIIHAYQIIWNKLVLTTQKDNSTEQPKQKPKKRMKERTEFDYRIALNLNIVDKMWIRVYSITFILVRIRSNEKKLEQMFKRNVDIHTTSVFKAIFFFCCFTSMV